MTVEAPYGAWESSITTEMLTAGVVGLSEPRLDGDDVYWLEARPAEAGRVVLVRLSGVGPPVDVTPAPFNVRTRVHEYGGGAYAVERSTVVFSNFADDRVYRLSPGHRASVAITPAGPMRYADLVLDHARRRVLAIREDHTDPADVVNTLVALDLDGDNDGGGTVLVAGADFISSPALAGDGRSLAWVTWDHPAMPWDATTLWLAELDDSGAPTGARRVAGAASESAVQPHFRGGRLHLISDRTGWWNLAARGDDGALEQLAAGDHDFADPQWVFGLSDYAFLGDGRILVRWYSAGIATLGVLDAAGTLAPVELDLVSCEHLRTHGDTAVFVAGFAGRPTAIVRLRTDTGVSEVLRQATDRPIDPGDISRAAPLQWNNADGETVYGFFYSPTNAAVQAPADELPPLLVVSHGGPTSSTDPSLRLELQYWTSRGFAVLDVNYGGSTGYGRAYRERLKGRWGIVDVEDCTSGARHLVDHGLVDGARLAIRGRSAGGYTTLAALAFRDDFAVGASHFGVGDLAALARDTHKFESRYLDGLVGPYPAAEQTYIDRSPVHHAAQMHCALILLQGLDDRVVPPNQAQEMADAVRANGSPVALVMFPGEGHGFRQAANIVRAIEAELYFYGRVFGFEPAGRLEPVPIDNL